MLVQLTAFLLVFTLLNLAANVTALAAVFFVVKRMLQAERERNITNSRIAELVNEKRISLLETTVKAEIGTRLDEVMIEIDALKAAKEAELTPLPKKKAEESPQILPRPSVAQFRKNAEDRVVKEIQGQRIEPVFRGIASQKT